MEYHENKRRGTDGAFLNFMAIGGAAMLKLLGVSAQEAENYRFRAVVLKEKRLEPDVEGIPLLESTDRKVLIEYQGYQDAFIRYRLMAKVLTACVHDKHKGKALAGIIYTDAAYQEAALPISAFNWTSEDIASDSFVEIVLTDYTEEKLKSIDPRLVVLAPFTVSLKTEHRELARRSRIWKREIEKVYPSDLQKDALDVTGLFVLNRFRSITREEVITMFNFDLMESKAVQEIYDEGIEKGLEKGIKEGMLEEAREMVVVVLEERFVIVPSDIIDKVHGITHLELLKNLHKHAVKCEEIEGFQKFLSLTE